jgi:hypothetical protein
MATSKLDILINAKNNASGAIKSVQNDLGGLDKGAGGLTAGLGKLTAGLTAVGIAAGALKLANVTFELGKLAATGERVSASFETIASEFGTTSDKMLSDMKRAMMGQVSNTELMVAANRAILTGAAQSAEDMTRILEVANARSNAMGISTTESMGRMVDAIARLDPTMLQSLGIIVDTDKMYAAYAQTLNKTASELTQAEKRAALLNETVRQTQPLIDAASSAGRDLAGDFEAMDTSITNAKQALGELFSPYAAAIARNLAVAVDQITASMMEMSRSPLEKTIDEQATKMQDLERTVISLQAAMVRAEPNSQAYDELSIALQEAQRSLEAQRVLTDALARAQGTAVTGSEKLGVAMNFLSGEMDNMGDAATDAAADADALAARLNALTSVAASAASSIKSSFTSAISNLGTAGALAGYQEASQQLKIQSELWKSQGLSVDEIEFRTAAFVNQIRTANSELGKTVNATEKIPDHIREAQQAFDKLTGQISGLINQSLDIGVGVNPDDFLPREDAINEDARRLADVMVNGFASPWASYFEKEFPSLWADLASGGDIQQSAARVLQEFQRGLRPELMDREAIKARIRQMLIGDENTQKLAAEIAQELSDELGISLQQANSAAKSVLGAGGDENTSGDAFGSGFVGGVKDGGYGAQAVEVLVAQLDGKESNIKAAGGRHGRWYGGNFLEVFGGSVPNGVLDILVDLITPGVLARVAGLQTQTGTVD